MKTWFVTGTSRGFGRVWAEAALRRGDRVVATARDTGSLDDLVARYGDAVLPLRLDVTDRAAVQEAVTLGASRFGRLDVIVNNAGYGLFGAIEEVSEAEARAQLETNLLGPLWVTQSAVPVLRAQGGGHVIQVSSIGGVAAFPMLGLNRPTRRARRRRSSNWWTCRNRRCACSSARTPTRSRRRPTRTAWRPGTAGEN